jgi:hypothetical protein
MRNRPASCCVAILQPQAALWWWTVDTSGTMLAQNLGRSTAGERCLAVLICWCPIDKGGATDRDRASRTSVEPVSSRFSAGCVQRTCGRHRYASGVTPVPASVVPVSSRG